MRRNSHLDLWKENNKDLLQKDGTVHICSVCGRLLPHKSTQDKEYHKQRLQGEN